MAGKCSAQSSAQIRLDDAPEFLGLERSKPRRNTFQNRPHGLRKQPARHGRRFGFTGRSDFLFDLFERPLWAGLKFVKKVRIPY
jgi:hypothetical protein